MSSLPTLGEEEVKLMREIEDLMRSDAPEEEIQEKLQEKLDLEEQGKEKLQGYYRILKTLQGHIDSVEQEKEDLDNAQKRAESALESLENNVLWYLKEVANTDELYVGPAHFRVNKVGGKRKMKLPGSAEDYPHETKKYRITVEVEGDKALASDKDEVIEKVKEYADEMDGVSAKISERVLKSKVKDILPESSDLVQYEPRGEYLGY